MKPKKQKVLFVCVHNATRSQMAQAWLTHLAGDRFEADSAGLEPGRLNPLAVEVMREVGLDISGHRTKSVAGLIEAGRRYDYVVTVCDEASAPRCPVVPRAGARLHWSFPDPAAFTGTPEQRLAQTRKVREAIRARVAAWVRSLANPRET